MSAATEHFRSKRQFEIDVMDVHRGLPSGELVLVDTRRHASWEHSHVPGAGHLPTAHIRDQAHVLIPPGTPVVVYSWGPAATAARLPRWPSPSWVITVREKIGGIEYWARNGLPVETADGVTGPGADPLVTAG